MSQTVRLRARAGRGLRPSAAVLAALAFVCLLAMPAAAASGPTRLLDASVSHATGTPQTTIHFEVTYRNREGSPPDSVDVVIGTSSRAMKPTTDSTNWKSGVRYAYSTTLPAGTHPVVFKAVDRERFRDELVAGSVTITVPATPTPSPSPTPKPTPKPTASPSPTPTPKPATPTPAPTSPAPTHGPPSTRPDPTSSPPSSPATPSPTSPSGGGAPGPSSSADATSPTADPARPGAPGSAGPPSASPGPSDSADPSDELGAPAAGSGNDRGVGGGPPDSPGPGSTGTWDLSGSLEALGLRSSPWAMPLVPTMVTTAGGVTLMMGLLFFGKRRRDGEPPAPDEVLAAAAARGSGEIPRGAVVGEGAPGPLDLEMTMPRWRRPSLMQARKSDPIRNAAPQAPPLSFEHGLVGPLDGHERRLIRYTAVRLLDSPDELLGAEIGFLDQGDEVQLLERTGTYWRVLTPDGRQGWLHRMTLGETVTNGSHEAEGHGDATDPAAVDGDVLLAYMAARARA